MRHARLMTYRAAAAHLDKMHREGFLSEPAWEVLRPEFLQQTQNLAVAVRDLLRTNPALAEGEVERARRELSRAQRSALLDLRRDGIISEEVLEALVCELDPSVATDAPDAAEEPPDLGESTGAA
jgi:hypothetical protein